MGLNMRELCPQTPPADSDEAPSVYDTIAMYQLRTRLVTFRVTEEEFEQLKLASANTRARCLSDFARSTMLGSASQALASPGGPIDDRLCSLERRLNDLEINLERIANSVVGAAK
jgi:hypothetical protein